MSFSLKPLTMPSRMPLSSESIPAERAHSSAERLVLLTDSEMRDILCVIFFAEAACSSEAAAIMPITSVVLCVSSTILASISAVSFAI